MPTPLTPLRNGSADETETCFVSILAVSCYPQRPLEGMMLVPCTQRREAPRTITLLLQKCPVQVAFLLSPVPSASSSTRWFRRNDDPLQTHLEVFRLRAETPSPPPRYEGPLHTRRLPCSTLPPATQLPFRLSCVSSAMQQIRNPGAPLPPPEGSNRPRSRRCPLAPVKFICTKLRTVRH